MRAEASLDERGGQASISTPGHAKKSSPPARWTRRTRFSLGALIVMFALSTSSFGKNADENDSGSAVNSKGYDRGSLFLDLDGPTINAFNFNFATQFPLAVGMSYPENAGISLRLNLAYNSRVWNWQNRATHRKLVRIRRQNPVGLGFDLSLGRVVFVPTNIGDGMYGYVDSSGATHKLFPTVPGGSDYRTHDGSHIRAVLTGSGAGTAWTISFPSGVVQELAHRVNGTMFQDFRLADGRDTCNFPDDLPSCEEYAFIPDPPNTLNGVPLNQATPWPGFDREFVGWYVTKVYSRAALNGATSPSYTVAYFGDDGNVNDLQFAHIMKTISDQYGRSIQFELDRAYGDVTRITAPAPANGGGSPRTADYLLEYQTRSMNLNGATHSVRVLTKLSGPNVAAAGEQRYVHEFDYTDGSISLVRYPSGRAVTVTYRSYSYRARRCSIPASTFTTAPATSSRSEMTIIDMTRRCA